MPEPDIIANAIFLPWVRQGAAANIPTADTLLANQPGRVSLPIKLRINNSQDVNVSVRLIGPGEVTAIDPQQVIRTEPRRGNVNFEPNYFAAIEFDRPDFPWLFTPAKAGADARLRPWLCLVVIKKQPGVALRADRALPLPMLDIGAPAKPGDELPDATESWAWVHAQLSAAANATATEMTEILKTRPELSVSRMLCPRLLEPETEYLACVVPTFELGRKAGLNLSIQPADEQRLDPAWLPGAQQVTLPVYYHWEFRTGAVGDFQSLVELLESRPAPPEIGTRPMDISRPGFKLPSQTPPTNVTLNLEGALRVPNAVPSEWSDQARLPFQQVLKNIINAPASLPTNQETPLVAPPIYGQWQAARHQVDNAAIPPPVWLDELNLDPRQRVVAGFGTQVVQSQQEQLMASAWEQAGEIKRANQRLRQEQLSLAINAVLHVKHFSRLSEDALLQVAAPAQARVVWTDPPINNTPNKPMSLQQRINDAVVPSQAVAGATRRLMRPRGAISRRVAVRGGQRTGGLVTKLNTPSSTSLPPGSQLGGFVTINKISESIPSLAQVVRSERATEQAVRAASPSPLFRVVNEGEAMPLRVFVGVDSGAATLFREAAATHQAKLNPIGISIFIKPRPQLQLSTLKTTLLQRFDPALTIKLRVVAVIQITAGQTAQADPLDTILAAPDFPQPMYEALRDLSQELLLPGLERVLPNTVTLLETNDKFVESFLVGLNTEMARELLWRGFPTDQRGTYFRRFWDAPQPDIESIHKWGTKALGQNAVGTGPQKKVVLLIRGELLSRYPNAVIYAAKAVINAGKREPGPVELPPIFRGTLQPDVVFLGFNLTVTEAVANPGWFFIIQEQPTEPRFGFDVGTDFGARTHVSVALPPPASVTLPPNAVWRRNAAHMAYITRQQPVRIAIHATQMIP